jgi:hypothetical protein
MLEVLSKNPEIQSFLNDFPKHQWRKCIEGSVVYGIRKLRDIPKKLCFEDILEILGENQEDTIRAALQNMRKEIEQLTGTVERIESRPKIDPCLKIPQITTSELEFIKPSKRESPGRSSSRSKQPISVPRQSSYGGIPKSTDRKIPKYLKKVQSKIKGEVLKDIAHYSNKVEVRSNSVTDYESRSNTSRELKEPNVLPLEKVKNLKTEDNEVIRIADDFLNNPFTSYLTGGYKYH